MRKQLIECLEDFFDKICKANNFTKPLLIDQKLATLILEMDRIEKVQKGELIIGDIHLDISKENKSFRDYVSNLKDSF